MSEPLPPCDHDECPPTQCLRDGAKPPLAPAPGSEKMKFIPTEQGRYIKWDDGNRMVAVWPGKTADGIPALAVRMTCFGRVTEFMLSAKASGALLQLLSESLPLNAELSEPARENQKP